MGHLRAPVRKKAATGVAAFKLRRFNRLFFLAIGRIVDGQRLTEFAIEFVISQSASRRRRNHTKLAAALGAKRERQFVFFFRDAQDDVEFGRLVGAQKSDRAEFALGVTIDAFEFLGYAVANAHDHAAFDLALDRLDIDGSSDVESRNGFCNLAVFV